ncbi:uncharacterized protein N7496_002619 [Penicillium cataractarum]|uniref:Uncharacterized protein n=1 Tax=Penicillium cataractarum TaxID=2100454 RepID=A0A9W9SKD4_9EURO|nr:uncharacterized protein N7496_002619 [Penicillium cataractarum]KAJ5380191.1 hypothetical protein N7496_002619 [Penicillium cataractarum]
MKVSFAALLTLAAAASAAPAGLTNLAGLTGLTSSITSLAGLQGITKTLSLGDVTKQLGVSNLPVVSKLSDVTSLLHLGNVASKNGNAAIVQNGHIVQDLAPELNNVLTITGPNVQTLLLELSPEVTALVSGLGLPGLGVPLGSIVASASSLGELVTGLGPTVEGLVTVVGADVGALLISLSPEVAGLVSGLGLPSVGIPVGTIVATIGTSLKRDAAPSEIVQDLVPTVGRILTVTGPNSKQLLIKLSPSVAALVNGLGLTSIGGSVGSVIKTAGNIGDLISDLSGPVKGLLTVTSDDAQVLLIQLSPEVTALVTGLGLPSVGVPVGAVVATISKNL